MHREEEIADFRQKVTNKYVKPVMERINAKDNELTKICQKCRLELPLNEFLKVDNNKFTGYCKFCIKEGMKRVKNNRQHL